MQFTTCAFIVSPLGYLWLEKLESWFPGTVSSEKSSEKANKGGRSDTKPQKPRLNVTNTVAKVLIDQTIGGTWNTVLFIITMGLLRGLQYNTIQTQIQQVCNVDIASGDWPPGLSIYEFLRANGGHWEPSQMRDFSGRPINSYMYIRADP